MATTNREGPVPTTNEPEQLRILLDERATLMKSGRYREALAPTVQAVNIGRDLARTNRKVFTPILPHP